MRGAPCANTILLFAAACCVLLLLLFNFRVLCIVIHGGCLISPSSLSLSACSGMHIRLTGMPRASRSRSLHTETHALCTCAPAAPLQHTSLLLVLVIILLRQLPRSCQRIQVVFLIIAWLRPALCSACSPACLLVFVILASKVGGLQAQRHALRLQVYGQHLGAHACADQCIS
jgi:hypothetical protein